jgi:predicted nucleic-acid-binding protein
MIVDTNVLVRAWAGDDEKQSAEARSQIRGAERIYFANATLCEFVWVARQIYKQNRGAIASSIRLLISDPRAVFDSPAVEAGLSFLDAGGDFADGVIEFEGRRLGGEVFVTFDRRAASIIERQGRKAVLLASD